MNTDKNLYHQIVNAKAQKIMLAMLGTFVLSTICCSCDDFVQVNTPVNQLIASEVFEESTTANAAMTDIYSKMRDAGVLTGNSSGTSNLIGAYADELSFYGGIQSQTHDFYNTTVLPLNSSVKNIWNNTYSQIYATNSVLEGVTNSTLLPDFDRLQLKGEALFSRALLHFYLTNLYGPVPYITTTNYQINSKIHRNSIAEVYNAVALDLEIAITLLDPQYRGQGRVRPNKFAAYALLARVRLYQGDWNGASDAASAVLNETSTYPFETDLNKVFLKQCTSTIWQFMPNNEGTNTFEGNTFIFSTGPPPEIALNDELLSDFEMGDLRKAQWIRKITDGSSSWSHAFKYKERTATATSVENSIVLRLGEVYLIRSEARARAGNLTGAKEDLNHIRNRAGLANSTVISQQDLLSAILRERRVELFTEFGHRFFDLKRFGKANEVLGLIKNDWQSSNLVLPLPQSELDVNPALLPQNHGY